MSGHSKWSTIKRAKEANDNKRGAIFTKLANIITLAVRDKGDDPEKNPSLRSAIEKAKKFNLPKNNIERAIKKGKGELEGGAIEELYYEGVLANNAQFIIKCLSDNKNRTAASIRHALSKYGGNISSTMWNFQQKGVIIISKKEIKEKDINLEELELNLIDQEIDDIEKQEEVLIITTPVENLHKTKEFIEKKNIETESAEIEYIAKEKQEIKEKEKIEKFIEELEELEDVNDYYTNLEL
jgi:YebC/PmpR family DNA-binding regulatory protein